MLWPKDSFLTISFSLDFSESYITQSFEESSDSGINFITNDFGLIARLGNFGTADTHFQNVSIFWTFSGNSATAKVYFFSYNTASYITANTYTYNSNYLVFSREKNFFHVWLIFFFEKSFNLPLKVQQLPQAVARLTILFLLLKITML